MSDDLNNFYLKNNRVRSFSNTSLFPMMEKLIETTYFPLSIYIITILFETIQILDLLWTYMDHNNLTFISPTYPNNFNQNFSLLSINQGIKNYITPYLTLLTIFNKQNVSLRAYFIFSCCHFGFEILFLVMIVSLFKEKIRESFVGRVLNKIIQYRLLLSLHFLTIYEFSTLLIIFKCDSSKNMFLNGTLCFEGFDYILAYLFNCLTLFLKLLWIYIFSCFYQDFTIFSNKLPWSSPYNQLMIIQNLFKFLLVIAVIFINSSGLTVTFKAIGILLFLILMIFNRIKCPIYFNQTVTYAKIYFEGVIFSFTLLVYGYSIFAMHFFNDVGNIDYYYLIGISFFLGGVFVYYILYFSDLNLLNFIKEMITKDHNVNMYNLYINLHKLELMIMNSKTQIALIHKLFMIFSCHFEYCNDEKCFCHEIDFMLKNKEVQFQLNQFQETNLIHIQRKDFITATQSTENDVNKDINQINKKINFNLDDENKKLTGDDDAKAKVVDVQNNQKDNLKKSNDRIFWGKFVSKLIYGYLCYKQMNNSISNKGKKRYFLSVIPLEENCFELVKIEYANMIMFYLNNPINALIECNLIRFNTSIPVMKFVIYLSMKRIFDEIYQCKTTGIAGVEMKNILLYNQLWTNLLFELKDNINNVKQLWINLSKRLFDIQQLERNCKRINSKSEDIASTFKDIMLINGLSTSSMDIDYKVFKVYGYYLKKIWKNDDNSEIYIKKAIDEISAANQMINIKMSKFDETYGRDLNYINSSFFHLNNTGIAIICGDMTLESFSKITYINESLWKNLAGYNSKEDLINKNINILMPDFIGICHDHYIKNFFLTSQFKVLNSFRSIFLIDKYKLFIPIKQIIKLFPSLNRGINFVGYVSQSHFYEGMTSKTNKIGYFLTDIKNKILFFDKVVKDKLSLPSSITYNITKLPEDDFYLHSIFPELLNESKVEELKRGAYRLIFNEFAIEKYLEKNKEEEIPHPNHLLVSFPSFNLASSDLSMYSLEKRTKQSFKMGLVDKKFMNFDTKYQHETISFNKAFNIYYIIFEKDNSDKVATILDELKCVEMFNNHKDDDDHDIGSISSTMSYSKGGPATSVNYMLSTIKVTLSSHKRPMILNIVGSMIIILLIVIGGVNIGEGAYLIVKIHELKYFVLFVYVFYSENYLLYSIEQRMLMWHYSRLDFFEHRIYPFTDEILSSEIQDMITKLSIVQSNITDISSHTCLKKEINSYIKSQVIPYRTFLTDKVYLESKKTLTNFELDFVQNIKNILRLQNPEPSKDITNFLIDFNGSDGYDFDKKPQNDAEFIINYLSYRFNFENNYLLFYLNSFAQIIQDGKQKILIIERFNLWIMVGTIIFLVLFYVGVSIMFYVLTLRIYSITSLLVAIPYHFVETCLNDINFLQENFDKIIYDDAYFISNNMNTLRNCYTVKTRNTKKNGDEMTSTNKEDNKSKSKAPEIPSTRESNRSTERKMLNVKESMNIINKHQSRWGSDQSNSNLEDTNVKGPESKNDEKFLKYDTYYQKKQYSHIKISIVKTSISILFCLLLLLLGVLYIGSYFCLKKRVLWLTNDLEVISSINNMRFNLPTMGLQSKLKTIENIFDYSISFSNYILYNQTYFNQLLAVQRNTTTFQEKILSYYNIINSYNSSIFCKGWIETKDLRYSSQEFNTKRDIENCLTEAFFSNGIELGAIRGRHSIRQLGTEWNLLPISELKEDKKRLEIIKNEIVNHVDQAISLLFVPLIDNFMYLFCEYHVDELQNFFDLCIERFVVLMVATILVVVLYFLSIQKKYFDHFENNKVLLLLIPLEYLKKNKKELNNYI